MRIRVTTTAGVFVYDDVLEYTWGSIFFFIGNKVDTQKIGLDIITKVDRWINNAWVALPPRARKFSKRTHKTDKE